MVPLALHLLLHFRKTKKIKKGVYKPFDVLYIIRANAEVVKRQTRCLQAAVPTRREGSNPFLRTICRSSLRKKAFFYADGLKNNANYTGNSFGDIV